MSSHKKASLIANAKSIIKGDNEDALAPIRSPRAIRNLTLADDEYPGPAPGRSPRRPYPPKRRSRIQELAEEEEEEEQESPARSRQSSRTSARKLQRNPDTIVSRPSSSLRRAAKIKNLRAGLAENYELPTSRYNSTLFKHERRSRMYLGESEMDAFGHVPSTDLSALDPPRSGYPEITTVGILERDPIPTVRVDPDELKTSITEALELGRQDFSHIIMKQRQPKCIMGNYPSPSHHPLAWMVAKPVTSAQYGYINEFAAIRMANGFTNGDGERLFSTLDETESAIEDDQCFVAEEIRCNKRSPYRTFDGTCNNLEHRDWGAAKTGQIRTTFAAYEDGISSPREFSVMSLIAKERRTLPNPRDISISLGRGQQRPDRKITMMVMQFGQWLAHDVVRTSVDLVEDPTKPADFTMAACCGIDPSCRHPVCDAIAISPRDPYYGPFDTRCLEFVRAQPANPRTCNLGPRSPANLNSHFLDASMVYGSSQATALKLRGPLGSLKINTSPSLKPGYILPVGGEDSMSCRAMGPEKPCMLTGDSRGNQHTGIVSMSALYIREHNRIAKYINIMRPELPDEVVYQTARRILIAEHQHITYNEYLPALLGSRIWKNPRNGLTLKRSGFCTDCYKKDVNPGISVEFSATGFRLHTMCSDWLPNVNASGWFFPFHQHMLNPEMFYRPGVVDEILQGMVKLSSESFDQIYPSELQNNMFKMAGGMVGQDMFAIDINRERDMGVPNYLTLRAACGLPAVTTFADLEDWMPPRAVSNLASIYQHILDIDGIVGAISEYPVNGGEGVVGPTMACLIGEQFARLKSGDRFWYENKETKFSLEQLAEIRKISLSALLCGNTPMDKVQPRAFLHDSPRNPVTHCETILASAMSLEPFLDNLTPERFPPQPAEVVLNGPPPRPPMPGGGASHGGGGPHGPGGGAMPPVFVA